MCAFRARKKAEQAASNAGGPGKQLQCKTRAEDRRTAEHRERNRLSQQKRRAGMTGQKKRRERERALTHYYKNKASLQVKQQTKAAAAPEAVVSFVSPAARRSAVYRLKKR